MWPHVSVYVCVPEAKIPQDRLHALEPHPLSILPAALRHCCHCRHAASYLSCSAKLMHPQFFRWLHSVRLTPHDADERTLMTAINDVCVCQQINWTIHPRQIADTACPAPWGCQWIPWKLDCRERRCQAMAKTCSMCQAQLSADVSENRGYPPTSILRYLKTENDPNPWFRQTHIRWCSCRTHAYWIILVWIKLKGTSILEHAADNPETVIQQDTNTLCGSLWVAEAPFRLQTESCRLRKS